MECNADVAVATALGVSRDRIEHAYDKGRVCKKSAEDREAVGLVDEDPGVGQPRYLEKLKVASDAHGVRCLNEGNRLKIVVLCPRLEDWLGQGAKDAGLDLGSYRFDRGALHAQMGDNPNSLKELVQELLSRESPRVLRLRESLAS